MNTRRKALEDGTFYGERYASSPVYQKGILGSSVADPSAFLDSPDDVEIVAFMQWKSWQPGGLEALAEELRRRWPERLMPRSLRLRAGNLRRVPVGEELEQLCDDIPLLFDFQMEGICGVPTYKQKVFRLSIGDLVECCKSHAEQLAPNLKTALLDPERREYGGVKPTRSLAERAPWYFPDVFECVRVLMNEHAAARLESIIQTTVAKTLFRVFEDAWETRQMFLALGGYKIGKNTAARAWCEAFPGRVRYVEVPTGNDDENFFRALSRSLGLAQGKAKGNQMRFNVEKMLSKMPLMLVFAQAAYLWPQNNRREALPKRIEWIISNLVDKGVPVVLLSRHQFVEDQQIVAKKTGWRMDQFLSRVAETINLGETLPRRDVIAISKPNLPHFEKTAIDHLADCVCQRPAMYTPVCKRAELIAKRDGRDTVGDADVLEAIEIVSSTNWMERGLVGRPEPSRGPRERGSFKRTPAQSGRSPGARGGFSGLSSPLQRDGNPVASG
ncbi:hypothetical protein GC207_03585 [bacterium]|nr:hypothetical protein [bacterium]